MTDDDGSPAGRGPRGPLVGGNPRGMTKKERVLVAGIGNVFFHDDAFGVAVAHQLSAMPPPGVEVRDFGIRALHLAYELLSPCALLVVVDCMPRGGPPGSLYVLEPETANLSGSVAEGHAMNLPSVFAALQELGGELPRTRVVGCEPESVGPGMGLSASVARAVPRAIELIRELINSSREVTSCGTTSSRTTSA